MAAKKKTTVKAFHLTPAPGYLIIHPQEAQEKTKAGIYLPDTADKEKPQKGEVIAVGDAEVTDSGTKKKSPVKVGDLVIYKKWGGTEVKIEGKELLFSKFEDILAIQAK